jgi:hypothetical protein
MTSRLHLLLLRVNLRLWRLVWRIRLQRRARQLTRMQRHCAELLLANHALLARLDELQ